MTHKRIQCPDCGGKGYHKTDTGNEICEKCNGCGWQRVDPDPPTEKTNDYHSGSYVPLPLFR